jgi:hypothetical protein
MTGQPPQERREKRQVQHRSGEPGDEPHRLAERLKQLALEEQSGLNREPGH